MTKVTGSNGFRYGWIQKLRQWDLGPFLLCLLHSYVGFLHMLVHSRYSPISHPIVEEREHFFFSISSKHPRADFLWTSLGHITHLWANPWGQACAKLGSWQTRVTCLSPEPEGGGSVPPASQRVGEGKSPPRKPGMLFPEEGGRVARLTERQTSTTVIWWVWAGSHQEPSFPIPSSLCTTTLTLSVA